METNDTRRAAGTIATSWTVGAVAGLVPALLAPARVDNVPVVVSLAVAAFGLAVLFAWLGRRVWLGTWALTTSEVAGVAAIAALTWAGGEFAGAYAQLMALVAIKAALHLRLRAAVVVLGGVVVALVALTLAGQLMAAEAWVTALVAVAVAVPAYRYAMLVRSSEARLEAQDQWWRASIGGFAHDARSPLTSILGIAELLEVRGDDPRVDAGELAGAVKRSAQRVLNLAEDLLDLQRVEDGHLVLEERTIPAEQLLHRVAAVVSAPVEIRAVQDVVVRGDVARLEQVLTNLVSNAVRYGRGPIWLLAERDGADVVLGVRDHGDGVPPEVLPKLFNRFGSGDQDGATGLGLWISKQLIEAHGGKLTYTAAEPGAQFTARLPDAAEPSERDVFDHYAATLLTPQQP